MPGITWRQRWCATGSGTTTWSTTSRSTPSLTSTPSLKRPWVAGTRTTRTSAACAASWYHSRHHHTEHHFLDKLRTKEVQKRSAHKMQKCKKTSIVKQYQRLFSSISDAIVVLQSKFIIINIIIVITSRKVFSWRSGPITAMIGTDRQGYVPGELIGFSAEVVWFDKRIYKHLNQNSDSNLKNCFRLTTKVTDWWQNLICIWLRWIWLIFIF